MLKQNLEKLNENLDLLTFFSKKYGVRLGDTANCGVLFSSMAPTVTLSDCALAGTVFGTDGWVRKDITWSDYYNWEKEVDGIKLVIERAELKPDTDSTPVSPKTFPLQLTDHAVVDID